MRTNALQIDCSQLGGLIYLLCHLSIVCICNVAPASASPPSSFLQYQQRLTSPIDPEAGWWNETWQSTPPLCSSWVLFIPSFVGWSANGENILRSKHGLRP